MQTMTESAPIAALVPDVQHAAYKTTGATSLVELQLCESLFVDPASRSQNNLHYDEVSATFFLNEQVLILTSTERQLLRHLYAHRGQQCSRESCFRAFGHQDYEPDRDNRILGQAVSRIRKKLRQIAPEADRMIETWRGEGYVLKI